jgi:hypothetical protein
MEKSTIGTDSIRWGETDEPTSALMLPHVLVFDVWSFPFRKQRIGEIILAVGGEPSSPFDSK